MNELTEFEQNLDRILETQYKKLDKLEELVNEIDKGCDQKFSGIE